MYRLALIFAGHMVDLPGRLEPRYPQAMTRFVDDVIKARLAAISDRAGGSLLGLSSAARGADLLFLDACRDLGLDTRIVLPEAPEDFVRHSVAGVPESDWVDKFYELWNAHGEDEREVLKVANDANRYEACNARLVEAAREAGETIELLTFWNGRDGDGPGGTASLVSRVAHAGGTVERLEAERLLEAFLEAGV